MTELQWQLSPRGLNPLECRMNVVLPEFDGRNYTVRYRLKPVPSGLPNELIGIRAHA